MAARTISRRAAVAGLTSTFVGGTLLASGAVGALASELGRGGAAHGHHSAGMDDAMAQLVDGPIGVAAQLASGLRFGWSATSPATHQGDRYRLVLTNGSTPQQVLVRSVIMDHRNEVNTLMIQEIIQLGAGERREFMADNAYGTANHFNTGIGSEGTGLTFEVTLTDSTGAETARFNQRAFMMREGPGQGPRPGMAPPKDKPHMHGQ